MILLPSLPRNDRGMVRRRSSFAASAVDDATDNGKRARRIKPKWKKDSKDYLELGSERTLHRKAEEVEALLYP